MSRRTVVEIEVDGSGGRPELQIGAVEVSESGGGDGITAHGDAGGASGLAECIDDTERTGAADRDREEESEGRLFHCEEVIMRERDVPYKT